MATAENIAIARRVDAIDASAAGLQLVHVRTTIVVYGRQEEPRYLTASEVIAAAEREPEPVELRRYHDLDVLIDPVTQARKCKQRLSEAGRAEFDELASRARVVDVIISCHDYQERSILSDKLTTAVVGGNRAGKSMALVWWLFRRWLLRGGAGRVFWWVAPNIEKLFSQGLYAIAGNLARGGGRWPDELMVLPAKGIPTSSKMLRLQMLDGSVIEFKHGAADGGNLKSANVTDIVIDELGEIDKVGNYKQATVRVSQTGGRVATATTRVRGHWMQAEILDRAKTSPASVGVEDFSLFASPWMTNAAILALFLNDNTLTERQLEDEVLPSDDYRAKCLEIIRSPHSLREHFGIETQGGRLMWTHWTESLVYSSASKRHATLVVGGRKLVNITAAVMGSMWPKQHREGRVFPVFAGVDFNVRGHAVVLELFGEGSDVTAAVKNRSSWHVLACDEVQVDGTTLALAQQLKEQAGACAVWHDPHGAKGHAARGSGDSTDADELRRSGHVAAAANGTDQQGRSHRLPELDSRNVLHRLMAEGRFLVHSRCSGLLDAMRNDLAKPDGSMDKRSSPNSESDFRSGYSDSARYAVWPLFRDVVHADRK